MASSKEYRDFVLGQFDMVPGLLVNKLPGLSVFGMSEAIPYVGGKAMWLVDEVDNVELLGEIMETVGEEIEKIQK